jgi:hypothetical protein
MFQCLNNCNHVPLWSELGIAVLFLVEEVTVIRKAVGIALMVRPRQ